MKRLQLLYLLILLGHIACSPSTSQQSSNTSPADREPSFVPPPIAVVGEGAYLQGELLYPLTDKPTPECHASTLVETPEGIVCAFFAGTEERHPDVGIRVSHWRDTAWTRPVEVVNGVQNDSLRYPCWNPVLFMPKGGPLMLFYKVGPSPQKWWGMLTTSTDNGHTWSSPRKLGEDPAIGHLLGPVKNKPIQLKDGTLLCPSSTETEENGETKWRVHFERSQDQGQSWEVIGPINDGITFDAIQPSILTYPDGRMQILCRSRQKVITQSWSSDQGNSWEEMTATSLPNPSAGTDAVTLKDGRQLLVYNHTIRGGKTKSGRFLLNVAISQDGIEWEPVLTLENDPTHEAGYSYPAVIQTTDGRIHITYTYIRESVKHIVLDPTLL